MKQKCMDPCREWNYFFRLGLEIESAGFPQKKEKGGFVSFCGYQKEAAAGISKAW